MASSLSVSPWPDHSIDDIDGLMHRFAAATLECMLWLQKRNLSMLSPGGFTQCEGP